MTIRNITTYKIDVFAGLKINIHTLDEDFNELNN